VGVLSEGIHSLLDLVSAGISYFTVREAGKPADPGHPFGHGKIETLSSMFEAILLVVAGAWICFEAFEHLKYPKPLEHQGVAIATIAVSVVISWLAYQHNMNASIVTRSSALRVNALHFLSDVVASGGILLGLILIRLTGWIVLDAIVAFGVAVYILFISTEQIWKALRELSDSQLPAEEISAIDGIVRSYVEAHRIEGIHDLRTRQSGATRHIDFHLILCQYMTVGESHAVCDELEQAIHRRLERASVNIHVEPCGNGATEDCACGEYFRMPRRRAKEPLR
jgi:cation diffusion facilitator family transporter